MVGPLRVVAFGECMLELQGQAFGTMRQTFGGDTLNTAVYLARSGALLGVQATYATGLGDDRYSDEMLRRWQREGRELRVGGAPAGRRRRAVRPDLTLLSRGVLGALTRYVLGDKVANWYDIPREPVWSPLLETAWVPFVGVREGLLNVGLPRETTWMFDELLRQFVLLYMSELRMPISIQIPTFNNPKYK